MRSGAEYAGANLEPNRIKSWETGDRKQEVAGTQFCRE